MAKFRKTQTSFSSGIIGPELRGRIDVGEYNNGALEIENFIGTEQGNLFSRTGTNYIPLKRSTAGIKGPFISTTLDEFTKFCNKQIYFFDIDDSEWVGFVGLGKGWSLGTDIPSSIDGNGNENPYLYGAISIKTGVCVKGYTVALREEVVPYTNTPGAQPYNVQVDLGDTQFLHTRIGGLNLITHTSGLYEPMWFNFNVGEFNENAVTSLKMYGVSRTTWNPITDLSPAFMQPFKSLNSDQNLKFGFLGTTDQHFTGGIEYRVKLFNKNNDVIGYNASESILTLSNINKQFAFGFPQNSPDYNNGIEFCTFMGYFPNYPAGYTGSTTNFRSFNEGNIEFTSSRIMSPLVGGGLYGTNLNFLRFYLQPRDHGVAPGGLQFYKLYELRNFVTDYDFRGWGVLYDTYTLWDVEANVSVALTQTYPDYNIQEQINGCYLVFIGGNNDPSVEARLRPMDIGVEDAQYVYSTLNATYDNTTVADNYVIPNDTYTTYWLESFWGGRDYYPKISTAIASRVVMANSPAHPTSIWFSLQDNIYHFSNFRAPFTIKSRKFIPKYDNELGGTQIIDAYRYLLTDELSREIRWLYPSRNLEFGTDVSEFTLENFAVADILGDANTATTTKFQSSYGGIYQNPLKIGNATIFILKDGKTLGRILFDFQSQANSVLNLNVLAPNILNDFRNYYDDYDAPKIKKIEWDHVRRLLWVLSTTGDLFTVSTSFNIDTFGWQKQTLRSACRDILITNNTVGTYSQDTPVFIYKDTIEHMVPRNEYPTEALDYNTIYTKQDNIFNFHYLDSAETLNLFYTEPAVGRDLWTFTNPVFSPTLNGTDIISTKEVHVFADNLYLGPKTLSPYAMARINGALDTLGNRINVLFSSVNQSTNGNSINLTFNGTTDSILSVVNNWNAANPTNQVKATYLSGDANQIPSGFLSIFLGGAGYNLYFSSLVNNITKLAEGETPPTDGTFKSTTGNFATVTAGFPFKRKLKKTLLHSGSNTESGLEAYKRVDQLEIKFYRSIYAKTGSEEGNLRDIDFPLQNDIINLQNYNYIDAFSGNSEPEHTVIVESELPLPVNILTITTRGVLAD
jgi:hypothetical protein